MRPSIVASISLLLCAAVRASGQCTPAIDKLTAAQRYDDARAAVQRMLAAKPADDTLMHCMASLYEDQGKYGDAVHWYESAVKADGRNPLHHLFLAQALGDEAMRANRFRQPFLARRVKSELERTVALDSTLVEAHEGLLQFYVQAPGILGGSTDRAIEQAAIIARLDPLHGHLARAAIAQHQKDTAAAEREYKAAIVEAPDSAVASYELGAFYENQKRWADAATVYDQLIERRPGELLAHYLYSRVAALSGDNLERGAREARYWLDHAPPDAPVVVRSAAHLRLGMILEREGQPDAARTEYEAALAVNERNVEAKRHLEALR